MEYSLTGFYRHLKLDEEVLILVLMEYSLTNECDVCFMRSI